jgi:ribokinase
MDTTPKQCTARKDIAFVGSYNRDMVVICSKFPRDGETVEGDAFFECDGGKGANQAVVALKILQNSKRISDLQVSLIAAVGKDCQQFPKKLEDLGMTSNTVKTYVRSYSGCGLISVNHQGENRIITAPGANHLLTKNDISDAFQMLNVIYVVVELAIKESVAKYALSLAKSRGARTILNPTPVTKTCHQLFQFVDILIVNEVEVMSLSDIPSHHENKISEQQLIELYKKHGSSVLNHFPSISAIVITLGSLGALCFSNKQWSRANCPTNIKIVDSTGAGDAFIGSFCLALAANKTFVDATLFAVNVSSDTVQRAGTQTSYDDIELSLSD